MVIFTTLVVPSGCNHSDGPQGVNIVAGRTRASARHVIHFKAWRLHADLTQRQVAEVLGVGTNSVAYWDGGRPPNIEYLPDIARAFGCTIDQLFQIPPTK